MAGGRVYLTSQGTWAYEPGTRPKGSTGRGYQSLPEAWGYAPPKPRRQPSSPRTRYIGNVWAEAERAQARRNLINAAARIGVRRY